MVRERGLVKHLGVSNHGPKQIAALNALGLAASTAEAARVIERYDRAGGGALGPEDFRRLVGEVRSFQMGSAPPPSALGRPSSAPMPSQPPKPEDLYGGWEGAERLQVSASNYDALHVL